MEKEITSKNTKAEIFKAFEMMKNKFKERGRINDMFKNAVVKKEEDEVVKKTLDFSPENLENDIATLRKKIGKQLDETMSQLTIESKKLQDLRRVKKIERRKLEEIYNIQLTSDTLEVLIADAEKKKKDFEEEMFFKKSELEKEIQGERKNWEREQEEYEYKLKFERKQEEETYDAEQLKKQTNWNKEIAGKEEELKKREEITSSKESELEGMRNQVEKFSKKLEDTANSVRHKTEKFLNREFKHEKQLLEQKKLAEENVLKVKIENLQNIIRNQTEEMIALKDNATKANQRSQNLAVSVVEGASGAKQLKQMKQDVERLNENKQSEN